MLRLVAGRMLATTRKAIQPRVMTVRLSHGEKLSDEQIDTQYIEYFDRKDIDHWELRSAINRLAGKLIFYLFPPSFFIIVFFYFSPFYSTSFLFLIVPNRMFPILFLTISI